MQPLKPNKQRAKNAITLIWIVLALDIVSLISGYLEYNLLLSYASEGEISMEAAEANDLREQLIAIAYMLVFIISAVTFIKWFRRAYANLHLRVQNLSDSEGWAAGAWFVPIVNLYKPYKIMKELFEETQKYLQARRPDATMALSTSIIGVWWALWIVNNMLGQIVFRAARNAETFDQLLHVNMLGMASNIVGILLALIVIRIIKNYSNAEEIMNAEETYQADGEVAFLKGSF